MSCRYVPGGNERRDNGGGRRSWYVGKEGSGEKEIWCGGSRMSHECNEICRLVTTFFSETVGREKYLGQVGLGWVGLGGLGWGWGWFGIWYFFFFLIYAILTVSMSAACLDLYLI